MALPSHRDLDETVRLRGHSLLSGVIAAQKVTGRRATEAEQQRRRRAGHRAPAQGSFDPWWVEIRNGLPEFRPYHYRGTGRDAFDGSDLFEEAS